jgi:NAD(P)-dependent dehydrogenase (short-subunit alcohol dehydrogenase family)
MMATLLITGGARGIGRATALLAAEAGWDVAVGWRERQDAAEAVVAEVVARGRRAIAVQGDVAEEASIVAMFAAVDRALGPPAGLVCSAGISHHARVDGFEGPPLCELLAVNVVGLMLCCREAVRRMSTRHGGEGGAIVNVSSMAATIGGRPGASAYAASKGAVDVFTTGLAKEVAAEGIRVNVVRPGVTLTDMTAQVRDDPARQAAIAASIPMQRVAKPEEVAEAIVWLLSDRASFVTGTHLNVGGGGFVIGTPTR